MHREAKDKLRYCWPRTLRRPPDTRIVYLDLNHWIALAKAYSGHRDGLEDRPILDRLLRSVQAREAIYPISSAIYIEIMKIRGRRRRSDLRKVFELLGRFTVVTARHIVVAHEIEALLDGLHGPSPDPVNTMDYLDWGIMRALGMHGGVKVVDREGKDVTAEARQRYAGGPDEFDRIVDESALQLNRDVLDGPAPEDEPEFRAKGYRPERILETFEQEASDESNFARLLDEDPRLRRGRLRDAVSAREVFFHINSILSSAAAMRGLKGFDNVIQGSPEPRRALDAMPSFDVSVTLKTAIHKNPNHRWKNNHIHDINALAVTLPYCDLVLTDREMAAFVTRSQLDQRLGTMILHDLRDLVGILDNR